MSPSFPLHHDARLIQIQQLTKADKLIRKLHVYGKDPTTLRRHSEIATETALVQTLSEFYTYRLASCVNSLAGSLRPVDMALRRLSTFSQQIAPLIQTHENNYIVRALQLSPPVIPWRRASWKENVLVQKRLEAIQNGKMALQTVRDLAQALRETDDDLGRWRRSLSLYEVRCTENAFRKC